MNVYYRVNVILSLNKVKQEVTEKKLSTLGSFRYFRSHFEVYRVIIAQLVTCGLSEAHIVKKFKGLKFDLLILIASLCFCCCCFFSTMCVRFFFFFFFFVFFFLSLFLRSCLEL